MIKSLNQRKNQPDIHKEIRAIPGGREIFDENGEIALTVDDVKQGKKLDVIEGFFDKNKNQYRRNQLIAEKLDYYRKLQPFTQRFRTVETDSKTKLQQETFKRNQEFLREKALRAKMAHEDALQLD